MTTFYIFVTYLLLTAAALVTARAAFYLMMLRHRVPDRPEHPAMTVDTAEALRLATQLRIDANAIYKQIVKDEKEAPCRSRR